MLSTAATFRVRCRPANDRGRPGRRTSVRACFPSSRRQRHLRPADRSHARPSASKVREIPGLEAYRVESKPPASATRRWVEVVSTTRKCHPTVGRSGFNHAQVPPLGGSKWFHRSEVPPAGGSEWFRCPRVPFGRVAPLVWAPREDERGTIVNVVKSSSAPFPRSGGRGGRLVPGMGALTEESDRFHVRPCGPMTARMARFRCD